MNNNLDYSCYTVIDDAGADDGTGNLKISRACARALCCLAFAAAVLYSVCFTGVGVYPQLSLFVFTCVSLVLLYAGINVAGAHKPPRQEPDENDGKTDGQPPRLSVNKKAFKWAVPLLIISSFNAVFELRFFSYVNVLVVHLMFAALIFSAITGESNDLSDVGGWVNILKTMFPNLKFPFQIFKRGFEKKAQKSSGAASPGIAVRVMLGGLLAVPVLLLITTALMSADAVFAHIVDAAFGYIFKININIFGHTIAIAAATVYFTAYVYNAGKFTPSEAKLPQISPDTVIGFTFLFLINALFLFFCVIQTAFLFTGGFMKLPGDIVYSAYAREGFFQLLFVTIINFGVIIIFLKIFPSSAKNRMLRIMLFMLCVFTGVLIASSFYRMSMYTVAYGYTDIRMNVYTFLAMEAVLILVTFRYLWKPGLNISFLKRYIIIGAVFYMAANISSSAYVVGRLNVNRLYAGYGIDIYPLCNSAETTGLLAEIYGAPEFAAATDADEKFYVHKQLLDRAGGSAGPWQNISVIRVIGLYRARALELPHLLIK